MIDYINDYVNDYVNDRSVVSCRVVSCRVGRVGRVASRRVGSFAGSLLAAICWQPFAGS